MSYSYLVLLSDLSPIQKASDCANVLRKVNPKAEITFGSRSAKLKIQEWILTCTLSQESYIEEESQELSAFCKDKTTSQQIVKCKKRIEVETFPEGQTDDHYNTWLLVQEHFRDLEGSFVFSPFEGVFLV